VELRNNLSLGKIRAGAMYPQPKAMTLIKCKSKSKESLFADRELTGH